MTAQRTPVAQLMTVLLISCSYGATYEDVGALGTASNGFAGLKPAAIAIRG